MLFNFRLYDTDHRLHRFNGRRRCQLWQFLSDNDTQPICEICEICGYNLNYLIMIFFPLTMFTPLRGAASRCPVRLCTVMPSSPAAMPTGLMPVASCDD